MTAILTPGMRADLRRRAEAATRGRWAAATPSDDTPETSAAWVRDALLAPDAPAAGALWCTWAPDDEEVPGPRIIAVTGDGPHAEADADWIAAASPAAVLALLDVLDAMEAERDALAALVRGIADWHETKADKARRFPGPESRALVMEKAAQVHSDAAWRIRRALDATGGES